MGDQDGTPGPVPQLTFSVQALAAVLDPAKTAARGGSGGDELAAVYDVLLRYDDKTGEFVPRLAQSLSSSDDGLVWTLKLRPGVTFSDGTPLDANVVVSSINRYNTNRGNGAAVWVDAVESTTAVDPQTVEFRLRKQWPTFPSMLALGHGMIVAPGAGEGEAFKPIGAGPFVLEALRAQRGACPDRPRRLLERQAERGPDPVHRPERLPGEPGVVEDQRHRHRLHAR
ncbi:ABC transporter substrate-binding protein [Prescottella defluvii]|nr:ABC transporter substrate-binding protein [Prescottella defluvii]